MARFYSLFSGSKGNASLVSAGGGSLLLDAGVSCRQILTSLTAHHIDPASIEGIFITHTHIDHIRGLQVLCKKLHTKIYGTDETTVRVDVSTEFSDGGNSFRVHISGFSN